MRYNILTYLIGEGFSNVFKNRKQAFTSIGTMCLTMLIFGIFFVIGQNLNHFVKQIENEQGMQVYMKLGVTESEIEKLKQQLLSIEGINTVDYVSPADSLQYMIDKMGKDRTEGYQESFFNASYIITLTDLKKSKQIQEKISTFENVDEITNADEPVNNLIKIADGIRIVTYVISACLVIFAIFIISNTIKLTVHARRREISIMKYVGATNSFIRWPFAVEGMIIGVISGAISIGILAAIYSLIVRAQGFIKFLADLGLTLLKFSDMFNLIVIVYLILGIGIGALGSTISMRKYLKV